MTKPVDQTFVKVAFLTVQTVFHVTTSIYTKYGTIKTRTDNLLDTDCILNLHRTFGRGIEHLLNVLCTFYLRHESRENKHTASLIIVKRLPHSSITFHKFEDTTSSDNDFRMEQQH